LEEGDGGGEQACVDVFFLWWKCTTGRTLSNFTPEEMEAAAKVMSWCTYSEGETIIQEGESITSASFFCEFSLRTFCGTFRPLPSLA
jgi:hypothetical protein